MPLINYGRQALDDKDILKVKQTLKSNFLTQGPLVEKFEQRLKEKLNSKYCTVLSSGTAALHLLSLALGWKKNDIIITTPLSFVATSNCILYSGAQPVFVDINVNTGNICTVKLEKKIKQLEKKNKTIKAVIAIDYGGCPSEWSKLKSITKKRNIALINDGCHGLGSKINNNQKYAIKYADFVTYSFHPVKPITTGEGGAVITNNKKIDYLIKTLRTHGIVKNEKKFLWHNDMKFLGYNYRITDIQCALGISQLSKINIFVNERTKIAKKYDEVFKLNSHVKIPEINKNFKSSYHLYPLRINFKKLNIKKDLFFKKLLKNGIKLQVHYVPIYRHSYYKKKFKLKPVDFPCTEKFYNEVVSLPIYCGLPKKIQDLVIKKLNLFLNK